MRFELLILLSAAVAGYFDFRWHRVPNWLIGLTVALSLARHAWQSKTTGLLSSLAGLLLGVTLLFPLFLLQKINAGDVKFFGTLGAALTYRHLLVILTLSLLVGAGMALFVIARRGAVRQTARNLAELAGSALRGRVGPHPVVGIDNPGALVVHYSVAQAVATWVFVLPRWGGLP
jgi:prepilin peptidase CpaA